MDRRHSSVYEERGWEKREPRWRNSNAYHTQIMCHPCSNLYALFPLYSIYIQILETVFIPISAPMSTGSPTCRCLPGFTGPNCNLHTCKNYCMNGGNCSVSAGNQPSCSCPHDFLGDQCQYSECGALIASHFVSEAGDLYNLRVCLCVCV